MKPYFVISTDPSYRPREFDTAREVAVFLLGRDFRDWTVYARINGLPCDVLGVQRALEEVNK